MSQNNLGPLVYCIIVSLHKVTAYSALYLSVDPGSQLRQCNKATGSADLQNRGIGNTVYALN